ncbi:MAG TPA: DMT family transporter [Phycisphaerales bacterium]|nr:DMT family transporter [Phycisphaerales bacterium]
MPQHAWLIATGQVILALLVGIATACQPAINAKFARYTPSSIYGGLLNFAVGLLVMVAVLGVYSLATRTPAPSVQMVGQAPWWSWIGGVLGAFFVTMSVILLPKMGAAVFVSLVVAGQLVGASIIDHYGLLDVTSRPMSWGRILGVILLIAGVVCIRKL